MEVVFYLLSITFAGVITSLLPCNYPLILGYISLITGTKKTGKKIIKTTTFFFFGFTSVFVIIGALSGYLGALSDTILFINSIKPHLIKIGGVFFIIIGLVILGLFKLPNFLRSIISIKINKNIKVDSWWGSFLVGLIFALSWSPCIGPILSSIFILSAQTESVIQGGLLFLLFSLGMFIPMVIFIIFYDVILRSSKKLNKISSIVSFIAGGLFILIGVAFLTGYATIIPNIPFLNGLEERFIDFI